MAHVARCNAAALCGVRRACGTGCCSVPGWLRQRCVQYTLDTLPRPNNPAVQLRELPPMVFAVVAYSGLNTAARVQEKTEELQRWIASRNLQPLGTPQLARYDPPWTLPMWRRNEVQVQVRQP